MTQSRCKSLFSVWKPRQNSCMLLWPSVGQSVNLDFDWSPKSHLWLPSDSLSSFVGAVAGVQSVFITSRCEFVSRRAGFLCSTAHRAPTFYLPLTSCLWAFHGNRGEAFHSLHSHQPQLGTMWAVRSCEADTAAERPQASDGAGYCLVQMEAEVAALWRLSAPQ